MCAIFFSSIDGKQQKEALSAKPGGMNPLAPTANVNQIPPEVPRRIVPKRASSSTQGCGPAGTRKKANVAKENSPPELDAQSGRKR